jgi:hypothetical protein
MRKLLTLAAAVLLICFIPKAEAAHGFADLSGHWSEEHMVKMADAGVIIGYGGGVMPDRAVTHREAAIMLARMFGTGAGDVSDVPDSAMNRFEAFTVIRGAFRLPNAPPGFSSRFPDMADIPGLTDILAMEYAGMIFGKSGRLALNDAVTRAEFATLLSRGAGVIIDSDADFEGAELPRVFISKPGLTVSGLTVESLTVAQGAGSGSITLANSDIGSLNIFGGGQITLAGTSVTLLVIDAAGISVFACAGSLIESAVIRYDDAILDIEGEFLDI